MPQAYSGEPETSIAYEYNDPWETIETHSIGQGKRTVKNARGQILYTEDFGTSTPLGASAGEYISARIGFAYSLAGQVVKKMDLTPGPSPPGEGSNMSLDIPPFGSAQATARDTSGNNINYWWYDGFGRLVASNDPDRGYTELRYNGFGNMVTRSDAMGRTTALAYDRLGRVLTKVLPGGEGEVTYTYDEHAGSENCAGRLVSVNDPVQRITFSYDRLGRVKREARRFNLTAEQFKMPAGIDQTTEFETLFERDLLGRAHRVLYPVELHSGTRSIVEYSYNSMGLSSRVRLTSSGTAKDIVAGIKYNEFGQMTEMTRGNGVKTAYEYDVKGRLMHLVSTTTVNETVKKVQDVTYSFNTRNSIVSMEDNPEIDPAGPNPSRVRYEYSYDGLNRLVHALGNSAPEDPPTPGGGLIRKFERGYGYAANGNLTRKDIMDPETHGIQDRWAYTYDNHAATGIDTTVHAGRFVMRYDSVGNMISKRDNMKNRTKMMAYDSNNRITEVINPDNGNQMGKYFCDDSGFRAAKSAYIEGMGDMEKVDLLHASKFFTIEERKDSYGNAIPGGGAPRPGNQLHCEIPS